jgi:hypothetical protein
MNISWVVSDNVIIDPTVDIKDLKNVGSIWGSWRTWRACQTDNVICHDLSKSIELVKRNFQQSCNLYLPKESFVQVDRPEQVNLYDGKFIETTDRADEIVAMHLSASMSDIILLVGFDLTEKPKTGNKLIDHKTLVYNTLIKHAIDGNPEVQWVLVDHPEPIMKFLSKLPNLTQDTLSNCLELTDI